MRADGMDEAPPIDRKTDRKAYQRDYQRRWRQDNRDKFNDTARRHRESLTTYAVVPIEAIRQICWKLPVLELLPRTLVSAIVTYWEAWRAQQLAEGKPIMAEEHIKESDERPKIVALESKKKIPSPPGRGLG